MKFRLSAEHIMYSIAAANALRFAWAYSVADAGGNVWSLPGAFGIVLGASISIGTAFLAGRLGGNLRGMRKVLTWASFLLLLVLEPVILAPITLSEMPDSIRAVVGWFSPFWAVTLALVPSLVMAGISAADGKLVESAPTNGTRTGANGPSEGANGREQGAPKTRTGRAPKRTKANDGERDANETRPADKQARTFASLTPEERESLRPMKGAETEAAAVRFGVERRTIQKWIGKLNG